MAAIHWRNARAHLSGMRPFSCIVAIRSWAAFSGSCPDPGLPPFAGSLAGNTHLLIPLNAGCVVCVTASAQVCEIGNEVISLFGDSRQSVRGKSVRLHSPVTTFLGGCTATKNRHNDSDGEQIVSYMDRSR